MRQTGLLALAGTLWLAGCAHQDRAVSPPAEVSRPAEPPLSDAVERRRRLARQYQAAGDLAAAATQWHILTLVAPQEETFRRELVAIKALLSRTVAESYQAGLSALKNGDTDEASRAMLRVLALAPEHGEAAQALRDIEKQKITRVQAERSARVRREDGLNGGRQAQAAPRPAEQRQTYDLEQRLDMFTAGDMAGGLRELRRYVEANPDDKAGRQRISAAIVQQAGKLDEQGAREQALGLYEQAVSLRGDTPPAWGARIKTLRKALAGEYYDKGMRVYRRDIALAIRHLETSLRFDPQHVNAALRLKEALLYQDRLRRIESDKSAR